MFGTIEFITKDDRGYRFYGEVLGENGQTYRFNCTNWYDRDIRFEDIRPGDRVEFDLRRPNVRGTIYPRQIRFAGSDSVPRPQDVRVAPHHSYGMINNFAYIDCRALRGKLQELVPDIDERCPDDTALFKAIIARYNSLQDDDFVFEGDEGRAARHVFFPSGFFAADGREIWLSCTPNRNGSTVWYCCDIRRDGEQTEQTVFDIANINWFDMQRAVDRLDPDGAQSIDDLCAGIEARCADLPSALLYLRDGRPCSEHKANELYVPTGRRRADGEEIWLLCTRHTGPRGYGWYFEAATYPNAPITVFDKNDRFKKWCGRIEPALLDRLAQDAMPEPWSFGDRNDLWILRDYLVSLFAYQLAHGAVVTGADGRYAGFDTGLQEAVSFGRLCALFTQTETPDEPLHPLHFRQPYELMGFYAVDGDDLPFSGGGLIAAEELPPMPAPRIFPDRRAMLWDTHGSADDLSVSFDAVSLLIYRCERLPLSFYRCAGVYEPRLTEILDGRMQPAKKAKLLKELFAPITDGTADDGLNFAFDTLRHELTSRFAAIVRRAEHDWRIALPCFDPEHGVPAFLLPLSFDENSAPDRAMIVTADGGKITVHSVVPPEWAYLDARLVCRPASDWLQPEQIGADRRAPHRPAAAGHDLSTPLYG